MIAESAVLVVNTDEEDAAWLAEQVAAFIEGLFTTMNAAVQISENWDRGRRVGRLHSSLTCGEYIATKMPALRALKGAERDAFIVRLIDSGLSRRQAAKAVGAGTMTVSRAARGVPNGTPKPDPSPADAIAKSVHGILGKRSTLPGDLARWLRSEPLSDERAAVADAFDDLAARAKGWADQARGTR
ncbi:MAG: hypothetical protein H0W36_11085 [Gemmatimonadetes bacterium]|nr:hypothetical protein [Gemmatimonadota bacterium]